MKTNLDALAVVDELLLHAYRKGALCDTPGGPGDMANMVTAVGILKKTAEWADGINAHIAGNQATEALRQKLIAEIGAKQAKPAEPCTDCSEKKQPAEGQDFTELHEATVKGQPAAQEPAPALEEGKQALETKKAAGKPA